jgi:asparagine synthase (glutamine-hydrolysing)
VCGIFGMAGRPAALEQRRVHRLLTLLEHRGPDDRGWLTLDSAGVRGGSTPCDLAGDVVLLHTRLAILDLSAAGHQPMSTKDGRYHLSFNGEIYNYVELREELAALGHRFVSGTDTEVLLAGWAEWGHELLERLVGMFAFSLVDADRRVLVLARDHFGIKPIFYAPLANGLAFASEIPPLLELPGQSRQANPQRVYDYLRFSRIDHGAETMFAGVRQVQPAHYLELSLDEPARFVERRYWTVEAEPLGGLSLDEAAERLRELFLDSVRIHLRSDVPVGAAFSGGVDSSANVTAMRSLSGPDLELHTFSYLPEDPALSEERWISLVADEFGVVQHHVRLLPHELRADLDRLIAFQGEPFNSTSIYAQYRVFQLAAEQGIKVMIDGQGADELFAGYRGYLPSRLAGLLFTGRHVAAARFVAALASLPGAGPLGVTARALGRSLPLSLQAPVRRFTPHRLVPPWLDAAWLAERDVTLEDPRRAMGAEALRQQRLESVQTSLRELLRYEDRNSMASSIESRVPFLTPALAEFALGLPDEHLIAPDGTGKVALKRALRGLVPGAILDRKDKIGFATPEPAWLGELASWGESTFDGRPPAGPLRLTEVRRRWHVARTENRPLGGEAWRCINLVRWADTFSVDLG